VPQFSGKETAVEPLPEPLPLVLPVLSGVTVIANGTPTPVVTPSELGEKNAGLGESIWLRIVTSPSASGPVLPEDNDTFGFGLLFVAPEFSSFPPSHGSQQGGGGGGGSSFTVLPLPTSTARTRTPPAIKKEKRKTLLKVFIMENASLEVDCLREDIWFVLRFIGRKVWVVSMVVVKDRG
jgi:hypothetical protein